jgi:hypothetical protein
VEQQRRAEVGVVTRWRVSNSVIATSTRRTPVKHIPTSGQAGQRSIAAAVLGAPAIVGVQNATYPSAAWWSPRLRASATPPFSVLRHTTGGPAALAIAAVPSVEPSSTTNTSMPVYVRASTDANVSRSVLSALYAGRSPRLQALAYRARMAASAADCAAGRR